MHPIIAKIGPIQIYSYGLMVALGFAMAVIFSYRRAASFNINKDKIVDFGIVVLIGGLIGARLFYIIANTDYYKVNPIEILNLTKGGLVWYGGFIFGVIVGVLFVRKNGINFWDGADLLAPFIALAQSLGRIGCFLNGCCYGKPAPDGSIFCVIFPNEQILRYPVQLYESLALLAVFLILLRWQKLRHFKGEIFLGYGMLYSMSRFVLEFFRGDIHRTFFTLTMAQIISILIFVTCSGILAIRFSLWKRNSSRSA